MRTDFFLQRLNLLAERGLADMQSRGGTREMQLFRYGDEVA